MRAGMVAEKEGVTGRAAGSSRALRPMSGQNGLHSLQRPTTSNSEGRRQWCLRSQACVLDGAMHPSMKTKRACHCGYAKPIRAWGKLQKFPMYIRALYRLIWSGRKSFSNTYSTLSCRWYQKLNGRRPAVVPPLGSSFLKPSCLLECSQPRNSVQSLEISTVDAVSWDEAKSGLNLARPRYNKVKLDALPNMAQVVVPMDDSGCSPSMLKLAPSIHRSRSVCPLHLYIGLVQGFGESERTSRGIWRGVRDGGELALESNMVSTPGMGLGAKKLSATDKNHAIDCNISTMKRCAFGAAYQKYKMRWRLKRLNIASLPDRDKSCDLEERLITDNFTLVENSSNTTYISYYIVCIYNPGVTRPAVHAERHPLNKTSAHEPQSKKMLGERHRIGSTRERPQPAWGAESVASS